MKQVARTQLRQRRLHLHFRQYDFYKILVPRLRQRLVYADEWHVPQDDLLFRPAATLFPSGKSIIRLTLEQA